MRRELHFQHLKLYHLPLIKELSFKFKSTAKRIEEFEKIRRIVQKNRQNTSK
ncbi:MAG: hypothetical protein QXJ75_01070 [Candidatus Bathyarchaeia archaeon]